jgi:hypothetical protein
MKTIFYILASLFITGCSIHQHNCCDYCLDNNCICTNNLKDCVCNTKSCKCIKNNLNNNWLK